ncbi:MAG: hypothetical protein JNM84_25495 [Planctomycetes bacterium]|nr:hypothetical protein [Planctomycetota bacterium]
MFVWLSRLFLAALLSIAGVLKLLAAQHSHPPEDLDLGWMAPFFEPQVVIASALVEIGLAIVLLSRAWRVSMLLTLILSLSFLALLYALAERGVGADHCGCFGAARVQPGTHMLLLLGMAVAAAGSLAIRREPARHSASRAR